MKWTKNFRLEPRDAPLSVFSRCFKHKDALLLVRCDDEFLEEEWKGTLSLQLLCFAQTYAAKDVWRHQWVHPLIILDKPAVTGFPRPKSIMQESCNSHAIVISNIFFGLFLPLNLITLRSAWRWCLRRGAVCWDALWATASQRRYEQGHGSFKIRSTKTSSFG